MTRRPVYQIEFHPDVAKDVAVLQNRAKADPGDHTSRNLLTVANNVIREIQCGHPGTHDLVFMPSYPDLSDCRTNYVGADPDRKPSHRIVWRALPPTSPDALPRRQILVLGERSDGQAYHMAGQRLARPHGVRLTDLRRAPEPVAADPSPVRSADRQPGD